MMFRSLAVNLPMRSEGASRLLRALHVFLKAIHETRARQAQEKIARRADLIESARRRRLVLDDGSRERRRG